MNSTWCDHMKIVHPYMIAQTELTSAGKQNYFIFSELKLKLMSTVIYIFPANFCILA